MIKKYVMLAFLFFGVSFSKAQTTSEKLNLPGDNLNLYAVLKIFQESETLESFEKKLNEKDSKINNLDLNGDNKIDYIKVVDNIDGAVHNIVLQTPVNGKETQDVAVIIVQKNKEGQVQIQIIGDEDLYGKDYIVEPNFDSEEQNVAATPNPGYTMGASTTIQVERTTTYVIASWPIVRYVYMPSYSPWVSPWYWDYYPTYWSSWQPYYWHEYYGWHYHWNYFYYGHYRRWNHCRYNNWVGFYYGGRRARSTYYYARRERGDFRTTYSRPDLMRRGSDDFRKKYPTAKSANDKLPKLDNGGPKRSIKTNTVRSTDKPIRVINTERNDRPVKIINDRQESPAIKPNKSGIDRPIKIEKVPSENPTKRNDSRSNEKSIQREPKNERPAPTHESKPRAAEKSSRKG